MPRSGDPVETYARRQAPAHDSDSRGRSAPFVHPLASSPSDDVSILTGPFTFCILTFVVTSLNPGTQPFTRRVRALRSDGLRFQDLVEGSRGARSSAWFNNLVNRGASAVSPPPADTWTGLAALFGTDTAHVREMIAEEWFGVRAHDVPDRVRGIAAAVVALSDDDFDLVATLVRRLGETAVSATDPSSDFPEIPEFNLDDDEPTGDGSAI